MNAPFEKLHHSLKQRNIDLNEYQNYLQGLELKYDLVTHAFMQRNIPLQDFYHFLNATRETSQEIIQEPIEKSGPLLQESHNPNRTLGGYQLGEVLGEGGMGIVYKAYHPGLNQTVALKLIKPEIHQNSKIVQRFLREIQLLAKLDHPGIVKIINSGEEDEKFYLVMEYIHGTSLDKKKENLSLREKLEVMMLVLEALAHAHEKKILHRDLKLSNILITTTGYPKIVDFGLAKEIENEVSDKKAKLTQSGILIGTLPYMAPEQICGERDKIDEKTDIYSVGICLYVLLCGQYPYPASTIPELLRQIEQNDFLLPSKKNLKLHRDLNAIVLKAIENEPSRRYPTATAFAQDLQNFLLGYPVEATLPSFTEKIKKWRIHYKTGFHFFVVNFFLVVSFLLWNHWMKSNDLMQQFQKKYEVAKIEYDEVATKTDSFEEKKRLFKAYHLINLALENHEDSKAEELKWLIGSKLLMLAYSSRSYYWANYLIQELENLQTISVEQQKQLKQKLNTEKKKDLTFQYQRLEHWRKKLKSGKYTPEEQKDAIYDLLKMSDGEIVRQIGEEIQQGTAYLLQLSTTPNSQEMDYYKVFLRMIKYWDKPELAPVLREDLKKLVERICLVVENKRNFEEYEYLILLFQVFLRYASEKDIHFLREIRREVGSNTLFWERTHYEYQKFLKSDVAKKETVDPHTDLFTQGKIYQDRKEYEKAIQIYTQALQENPHSVEIYVTRGATKVEIQDYEGALNDFTEAIRLNPQFVHAYNHRGAVKETLKQYAEAIADYTRAIQIDPQLSMAYNNRANTKEKIGDTLGAIADYTEAIRIYPQYTKSYYNRGLLKFKMEDYEGAIADCNELIHLNPEDAEAYLHRGISRFSLNEFTGALADYNEAIQKNPQLAQAYSNRGYLKMKRNDLAGAMLDYQESLRLDPNDSKVYNFVGLAHHQQNNFSEAIHYFGEAIRLAPQSYEAYQNRGLVKLQIKDYSGAMLDYSSAIQYNPRNTSAYQNRGSIKQMTGDLSGAIEDYNRAIELDPHYVNAYFNRGWAYYNKMRMFDAKTDFLQFLTLTQQSEDPQILKTREQIFSLCPELKTK